MTSAPTIRETAPPAPASRPPGDQAGRVEGHGIDYIPADERHGRARELFAVWAAPNITYLYIVLGGTLVLLGLNAWQAMVVVLAGNLFWALIGVGAVSGPAAGTPSSVIFRAMFGIRGNRVNIAVLGWGIDVAYEAINLAIGALAGFALLGQLGLHPGTAVKVAVVLGTAVVTLTISVYGHATIVRLSSVFTIALTACVVVLAIFIIAHADLHYAPVASSAPHGTGLWAAALAGFTIIASGPLSWGVGADYSRYLPAATSPRAVAGWTALGGFVPAAALGGLGVLAGTAVDMTDPQTSLRAILPSWFYPVFLLVILVGSITNNVLTAYSSGLALQSIGIPWKRPVTVFFDGIVGVAITCYALFISDFLDTLNNLLALSVALLGPSIAIYAADIVLRRNRYRGPDLHDEKPGSPYWYHHGINWAGVSAQVAGSAAALLCVNTPVLVGPVARMLAGADLSSLAGPLVAVTVYAAVTVHRRRSAATWSGSNDGDVAGIVTDRDDVGGRRARRHPDEGLAGRGMGGDVIGRRAGREHQLDVTRVVGDPDLGGDLGEGHGDVARLVRDRHVLTAQAGQADVT
jgi:NCS1 family nucleobase:cation symporter-1